ncbi:MAG: hypothetical protein ACLFRA_01450 [Alphaproteobacteria bacterium]
MVVIKRRSANMTLEQGLSSRLENYGFFSNEISNIIQSFKYKGADGLEEKCWDENYWLYPAGDRRKIWEGVRREALEWIKDRDPEHFAKAWLEDSARDVLLDRR